MSLYSSHFSPVTSHGQFHDTRRWLHIFRRYLRVRLGQQSFESRRSVNDWRQPVVDLSTSDESQYTLVSVAIPSCLKDHLSCFSAVNEDEPGALQSFVINSDTGLLGDVISTVPSGGDAPAFNVPLSTGQVAIMNVRSTLFLLSQAFSDFKLVQHRQWQNYSDNG